MFYRIISRKHITSRKWPIAIAEDSHGKAFVTRIADDKLTKDVTRRVVENAMKAIHIILKKEELRGKIRAVGT